MFLPQHERSHRQQPDRQQGQEHTMENQAKARLHLREAELHLIRAEGCIKRQTALLKHLIEKGDDITDALQLLHTFTRTLQIMQAHRDQIWRELNQ